MDMKNKMTCLDMAHEFWLVYCELKEVEVQPESDELFNSARRRLGELVNVLTRRGLNSSEDLHA